MKCPTPTYSITKVYKVLLFVFLLWGLPYTPSQCGRLSTDDSLCWFFFASSLLNVCRTLIGIFSLCYTSYILPNTSLVVTFNAFIVFALVVNWCVFFKRQDVLHAIRMIAVVIYQVSPRKFRSSWSIYLFIVLHIIGCIMGGTTMTLICLRSYERANMTSSSFLWYGITEESSGMFGISLAVSTALTFLNCSAVCFITAVLVSTTYFHLGDAIDNFGSKLLRRLENQPVNKNSIRDDLTMFQRITSLNRAVNDAFSTTTLFIYAALMSIFITAIFMARSLKSSGAELRVLVSIVLGFALLLFFAITQTGERIMRKDAEFKLKVTSCTQLVIDSDLNEKGNMWFSLMSTEMKSVEFQVLGGSMFVISNKLILTVASVLITYGVIIFQMD